MYTGSDFTHSFQGSYDDLNNLTSVTETLNGTDYVTSYSYDDDNRVTNVTSGSVKSSYAYDAYSRLNTLTAKYNNNAVVTQTVTYNSKDSSHTSSQVATWKNQVGSTSTTYSYTYDDNGNITAVSDGTYTTSYVYDGLNQLTRENNQQANKTWTYTYDAGGNITEKKEYNYTTGTLGTALDIISYTYGDSTWGDLLTAYDGQTLTTDEIGNLTNDGTWSYEWKRGRQLEAMYNDTTRISYEYNPDGLRIEKSAGSTTWKYYYSGSTLTHMTNGTDTLHFSYDSSGVVSVSYNGTEYFYVKNMQGDVVALANTSGQIVVEYTYDAWGKPLSTTGSMANTLGLVNPLRYRSYFYDIETSLYYVNSRYYNPTTARWLCIDRAVSGIGGNLCGYNLFSYCFNNPVNCTDNAGTWPKWLEKAAVVASVAIAVAAVTVMASTVASVVAGTIVGTAAAKAITGASVFLGAALSGINGGVANASKGNSYVNGYFGGATGGAIQSRASVNAIGTITGGGVGVAIGTTITDVLNNIDPDSANSTAQEIFNNATTSGFKALGTSTVTAFMNGAVGGFTSQTYTFEGALATGADGLMPQLTPGFGEGIKAFFGSLDDALVYLL